MAEAQLRADHERHDHERHDVNLRWMAYCGIALVVLLVGSAVLMWWLFDIFDSEPQRVDTPTRTAESQPLPPGPRLQASPVQDMQEMLATERRSLEHYAWVDPSAGVVRIPIERAMEWVATQGLPDWRERQGSQQKQPEVPGELAEGGS
jgi:hypothetical protein